MARRQLSISPSRCPDDADVQELVMRGSTVDQGRKDIDPHHPTQDVSQQVSEQIHAAELAAGLQPLSSSQNEADAGGALWFAVGAGISAAIVAVAAAVG
jgi:hypothetical protein